MYFYVFWPKEHNGMVILMFWSIFNPLKSKHLYIVRFTMFWNLDSLDSVEQRDFIVEMGSLGVH